jgi:hypothetical protein
MQMLKYKFLFMFALFFNVAAQADQPDCSGILAGLYDFTQNSKSASAIGSFKNAMCSKYENNKKGSNSSNPDFGVGFKDVFEFGSSDTTADNFSTSQMSEMCGADEISQDLR